MSKRLEIPLSTVVFITALCWWGAGLLGLVHWFYNFRFDQEFLTLSQIKKSLCVVLIFYFGGGAVAGMIAERWTAHKVGRLRFVPLVFLVFLLVGTTLWAVPVSPDCEEVVRRMKESGVAYEAKERGLLGGIKIDEPSGDRFSPESKQLVWWGKFDKPFEYWGNPDLTADWFNPEGQFVASIEVDTEKCKLARAVIRQEGFKPGMWRVDVSCDDGTPIDRRQFGVGYPPAIPQDIQVVGGPSQKKEEARLIEVD